MVYRRPLRLGRPDAIVRPKAVALALALAAATARVVAATARVVAVAVAVAAPQPLRHGTAGGQPLRPSAAPGATAGEPLRPGAREAAAAAFAARPGTATDAPTSRRCGAGAVRGFVLRRLLAAGRLCKYKLHVFYTMLLTQSE